jgi:hypothetical protein
MSPDDAIGALYRQAAEILGGVGGAASTQKVQGAFETLTSFAQTGDKVSLGLFPLALALLILHENYQAATGDGRFRVAYVLGRAVAIAALIHPWTYGRVCGLITYAAGGHGGFLGSSGLLGSVGKSVDGLKGAFKDLAGDDAGIGDSLEALLQLLPLIGLWLILIASLLLAYVAGLLLTLSQAVLLSILLAVGKTCLTATLVPGVGLGASWARSLAKVAAWSTIAAIVTSLLVQAMPDLRGIVANMAYSEMMRVTGQFVVLAVCTFAVPVITERIFSGAAPHGNAALEAITKGWHGARAVGAVVTSKTTSTSSRSPDGGADGGFRRPHKVPPSRLRQGLQAMGSVAAAPIAAFDALRRRARAGGVGNPPDRRLATAGARRAPRDPSAPAEDAGSFAIAKAVLRRSRPASAFEEKS